MGYRKIAAAGIFDGYELHRGKVLVLDHNLQVLDLIPVGEAGDTETVPGWLMPGLVNCHCHLELSHLKGTLPEGSGLIDFVSRVIRERHHPEEVIREAIAKADEEMVRTGTVAVGDICNNLLTISQKRNSPLVYRNFIEVSGWVPQLAAQRMQGSVNILNAYRDAGLEASLVPHAPYSVSEPLWAALQPYFNDAVVSIHNQESPGENEFFQKGTGILQKLYEQLGMDNSHFHGCGTTSLRHYFPMLEKAARRLLVHNSFITEEDIEYLKDRSATVRQNSFFCLCPRANHYIERTLPPVDMLISSGLPIVLGTDSLASNHSLDLFDEIRFLRQALPQLPLEMMLGWATRNGAVALGVESQFGSFERGKRPGVLHLHPETLGVSVM